MFVIAFRTSVGDFDMKNIGPNSDYKILAWVIWLIVMVICNVVFMNFIIAVVG